VENETMDSATLGVPRDAPGGYYLKDVLYTQYFTPQGGRPALQLLAWHLWLPRQPRMPRPQPGGLAMVLGLGIHRHAGSGAMK